MDYQNGKIYTIRSHLTDEIYIGSTTQPLTKRLSTHKAKYKQWKKGEQHYTTSFKIIDFGDAYIELLEECPCNSKMILEKREGELIRSTDCVNRCIPGRTKKEYYEDKKDKILEQRKEYRKNNNDKIKEWRENNKDKIKGYYQDNKDTIIVKTKQYKKNNKDKISKKSKEYYEKNIETRICVCGVKYNCGRTSSIKQHYNSNKHIEYITSLHEHLRELMSQ